MSKVNLEESTLEKTARILSQAYGIRVVFKEGKCRTDGSTIYLPLLPDDVPQKIQDAVQGYLDHETGHILYSDLQQFKGLSPSEMHCANIVEDLFIERKLEDAFPGSMYNLRNAYHCIYEALEKSWEHVNPMNKILVGMFVEKKYPGSSFYTNVVEDNVKEWVTTLNAMFDVKDIKSSADSIRIGRQIHKVLESMVEEWEADNPPEDQSVAGQSGEDTSEEFDANSARDMGELIAAISEKSNVANNSGYEHTKTTDGNYTVWSTEYDKVVEIPVPDRKSSGTALTRHRTESQDIVGVMKNRLVNSLRAVTRRRWSGNRYDGKLDSRRLYRAILGISDAVYKVRTQKVELDTVVAIAIDHSGSMHGDRIRLAARSVIVLGDVLRAIGVPFVVYGFSTDPRTSMLDSVDRDAYARWCGHWIGVYKTFTGAWELSAQKLAVSYSNIKSNTLDGESVRFGCAQLLSRPEKRKVLLVFSDGWPYPSLGDVSKCQKHLKDVVESAANAGIEVVAYGVQSDAVEHYYPEHVVIDELGDLVKAPLAKLEKLLLKGLM